MSKLIYPQNEVSIFKPNDNIYTVHMLGMEVTRLFGVTRAIAQLAIAVPEGVKNFQREIEEEGIHMIYKPGLREADRNQEPIGRHYNSYIELLDWYQPPKLSKNERYLAAIVAADEFHYQDASTHESVTTIPNKNANVYDFALEFIDKNGSQYLGLDPSVSDPLATKTK